MTAPQTDAPTLQDRLRGDKIHWLTEVDVKLEAADALDAHEATIAVLVDALERIVDYTDADINDWPRFASAQQTCRQIARAALK